MAALHPLTGSSRGVQEQEIFKKFFEHWLCEQDRYLHDLLAAAANNNAAAAVAAVDDDDIRIRVLIDRVMAHYEHYYRTKSASAKRDVRSMFNPPWTSSTEKLFFWVGGWRPSTAFHILYSKSGLQVESQLAQLVAGVPTGDLADLSPEQLERIDRLQRRTIRLEKEISEEEASIQETVADSSMVGLSHVITEGGGAVEGALEAMEMEIKRKGEAMERVLERADQLRLDTLKGVVEILKPMQAVHFLIAAAELHLRVHEFGKRKDESSRR